MLAAPDAPPGAGAALDAGWMARLVEGRPVAPADLVRHLAARGGDAAEGLRGEARRWASARWLEALALALRDPHPARTAEAAALRGLAGGAPTTFELARLREGLALGVDDTTRRLALLEAAPLEAALAALRGAHELVLPWDPAPYLAAALELPAPARALRLHAFLSRGQEPLRWRPVDRAVPAGQEEALRPLLPADLLPRRVADGLASEATDDFAEAMVGTFRVERHHLSAAMRSRQAPLMSGPNQEVVRLLRAISAERPWSAAARLAAAKLRWSDATPGAALGLARALGELLALPASDLRDGLDLDVRRDLILCALDAFAEAAAPASLDAAVEEAGRTLLATHHAAVGARGLVAVQVRRGRGARELHALLRASRYPDLASRQR
jgi:hypothetical protein